MDVVKLHETAKTITFATSFLYNFQASQIKSYSSQDAVCQTSAPFMEMAQNLFYIAYDSPLLVLNSRIKSASM
jgi:hypothetical protein